MRFPSWLGSIRHLFQSRTRLCSERLRNKSRHQSFVQQLENLEPRKLLTVDFVSALNASGTPFYVNDVGSAETFTESPDQITLRLTPGVENIDPSTLNEITVTRSGGATDAFGSEGSSADVNVDLGAVLIDDLPNENQIVIRFKETLPDDIYRITIGGGLTADGQAFNNGQSYSFDVRVSVGSQVVAVVPQPVSRESFSLSQSKDSIEVYFDGAESLDPNSAETPQNYRLIEVNEFTGRDIGEPIFPSEVTYSSFAHKATLRFSSDLDGNQLFRLEVGSPTETERMAIGSVFITATPQTPPATPAIDPITNTFGETPDILGTGVTGATVTLLGDHDANETTADAILGTAVVDGGGDWVITSQVPLHEGDIALRAFQEDAFGNKSNLTPPSIYTNRTTAPLAPAIGSLVDTADTTPFLWGAGEVGANVVVEDVNGTNLLTTTVDAEGFWSGDASALTIGIHELQARQNFGSLISTVGTGSIEILAASNPQAPDAPVITPPPPSSSDQPTITGTGEPGATVTLKADVDADGNGADVVIGTGTVGANGEWHVHTGASTPFTAEDPSVALAAFQEREPGAPPSPEAASTINIDLTAPAAVSITAVPDTGDQQPLISGTGAEANATIDLEADLGGFVSVGTTQADASGVWALRPNVDLTDGVTFGAVNIQVFQTDSAGNQSVAATATVTIEEFPTTPTIDRQSPTNANSPTITGRGAIGASVLVLADADADGGGPDVFLGQTVVDGTGSWSLVHNQQFAAGEIELQAIMVGGIAPGTGSITVDRSPPADVVFDTIPPQNTSQPTITGTGEPGATVTLMADVDNVGGANTVIGDAVVNDDGTWTIPSSEHLKPATILLSAIQVDEAGNESSPVTAEVVVDLTAHPRPSIDTISPQSTGTPTITGTGVDGATIRLFADVDVDGGDANNLIGETTVSGNTWSIDVADALSSGVVSLRAVQLDAAGNVSNAGYGQVVVNLEALPPVLDPIENPQMRIRGTGEPNATVTVFVDIDADGSGADTNIGQAVVDGFGRWVVEPNQDLPTGAAFDVEAEQTDSLGNVSPRTAPVSATINLSPTSPTVDALATTNSLRPVFTGTAAAGESVQLLAALDPTGQPDNFVVIGTATASSQGTWSITSNQDLALAGAAGQIVQVKAFQGVDTVNTALRTVTIDQNPSSAATIVEINDTANGYVTISGTGSPPDARIMLYGDLDGDQVAETLLGVAAVDGIGDWEITPTVRLSEGSIRLEAMQMDPAGNESPVGIGAVHIDTLPPASPTISASTSSGLSGTGEPGSVVRVRFDSDSNGVIDTTLGDAIVNDEGQWFLADTTGIPAGSVGYEVTQTDSVGNFSEATSASFSRPDDGLEITTTGSTANQRPLITGVGTASIPGVQTTTVTLFADLDGDGVPEREVGRNTTDTNGDWDITPNQDLPLGNVVLHAYEEVVLQEDAGLKTSFASAQDLGPLDAQSLILSGTIEHRDTVGSPLGDLLFPRQPGSIDEPGHRDLSDVPIDSGAHGLDRQRDVRAVHIPVVEYNFQVNYGDDVQGNPVFNQITEEQKQRTREIFDLYSNHLGVRFVETAAQGITVVTGDVRVAAPDLTGAAGVGAVGGYQRVGTTDGPTDDNPRSVSFVRNQGGMVIMNSALDWGGSQYGGSWFNVAAHEIGHALGLPHAYDVPASLGGGPTPENLIPADYDLLHLLQMYPRTGTDIDIYQFDLPTNGTLSAETVAGRPGQQIDSELDTVLTLYREDANGARTIVARNDNSIGRDSFFTLELEAGTYFLAVTSTGNTDFNPEVEESGSGGRTEGDYQLEIRFIAESNSATTIVDSSATPLDGDRDGLAGGTYRFWFKTADAANTVFVDKISTNAIATVVGDVTESTSITVDDVAGIEVDMVVFGEGLPDGLTVSTVNSETNTFTVSEAISILDNEVLRFVFPANQRDGSLADPFVSIADAILDADANGKRIIRIVGNNGTEIDNIGNTGGRPILRPNARVEQFDPHDYYVGKNDQGVILPDGETFNVPAGVTVMVDAGAVIRMSQSNIDVGSSSDLVSREAASLQILGIPGTPVELASQTDEVIADPDTAVGPFAQAGQWGGIVFRHDSDSGFDGVFLNSINQAVISYGGGQVVVDSETQSFTAVQIEDTRPSLGFSTITANSASAISATPNAFLETDSRVGPDLRGNRLRLNSVNGLAVKIETQFGVPVDTLDVAARFNSQEVPYVLTESLFISGGAGGYEATKTKTGNVAVGSLVVTNLETTADLRPGMQFSFESGSEGTITRTIASIESPTSIRIEGAVFPTTEVEVPITFTGPFSRPSGRLSIDPGVVLKLDNSRIELQPGLSQLFAEGETGDQIIFTSLNDNRFGAGGTFDTNGNQSNYLSETGVSSPYGNTGRWGGIFVGLNSTASLDNIYLGFAGGTTPIEGGFADFNPIEVHRGNLRLANSRLEYNANGDASGQSSPSRNSRGTNAPATVFVRDAQPAIIGNDFRENIGSTISINANSLNDLQQGDTGGQTGRINRFETFDHNVGPLVRENRLSYEGVAARVAAGEADEAIAGIEVRGSRILVESKWDDVDIVHILRNEIIVDNFHTATGLRLQSSPDASLVVKLDGPNAGFTATGQGADIEDRVGGTIQMVGYPDTPVIFTALGDDSIGASLNALGLPVNDTNVNRYSSEEDEVLSGQRWKGLEFLPYSNDRNVRVFLESELAHNAGVDVNNTIGGAEQIGVLAPNFTTGVNTFESVQEKSGDENRPLGFEIAGAISYDDSTDTDVYAFVGYAGSEVWLDVDNTSSSLNTVIELLDAEGEVLARSADAQRDTGTIRNVDVTAVAGGSTTVVGPEARVVRTAGKVTHAAATVVGQQQLALGAAVQADGVFARVQGELETVVAAVTDVLGVAATVTAVPTNATIAIDTTFGEDLTGAVVRLNGEVQDQTVVSTGANSVTLSANLTAAVDDVLSFSLAGVLPAATPVNTQAVRVAEASRATVGGTVFVDGLLQPGRTVADIDGDVVTFDDIIQLEVNQDIAFGFVGGATVDTDRVLVNDETGIVVNAPVSESGPNVDVDPGTTVNNITPSGPVALAELAFNNDVTVQNGSALAFGFAGTTIDLDTTGELDGNIAPGANVFVSGAPAAGGVTVVGVAADAVTLSGNLTVLHDEIISFDALNGAVLYNRFTVADANQASSGGDVFVNGTDSGVNVQAEDNNAITLNGDITFDLLTEIGLGFVVGNQVITDTIFVADITGIDNGVLVNGVNGIPDGTQVNGVPQALATGGIITLSNDVTLQAGNTLGFGFNGTTVQTDNLTLDNFSGSVLRNGVVVPNVTILNVAAGVVTFDVPTNIFADGDTIGLQLNLGSGTNLNLRDFYFEEDALPALGLSPASVGSQVGNGNTLGVLGGTQVIGVSDDGMVTLSQPVVVALTEDLLTFSLEGPEVSSKRVVLDDSGAVLAGVLVTEVGALPVNTGVPDGTTVADNDPALGSNIIELSDKVTLSDQVDYGFGFFDSTIVVQDATGITVGDGVRADGVLVGTTVTGTVNNPGAGTDEVTLADVITVADGAELVFQTQPFNLLDQTTVPEVPADAVGILPETVRGVIYSGNQAIQSFRSNRDGSLSFVEVGDPVNFVTEGTIDYETGAIALSFNQSPLTSMSLQNVTFSYSRVTIQTLGFKQNTETGEWENGALPLQKDEYRGEDYYTTNPRDAGMRVILPGIAERETQYFVRVRSQALPGANLAAYETSLDLDQVDDGKTSGNYELRVRLQQRDEKPGSTVLNTEIRYAQTGITVEGLPSRSPLVGEIGEQASGGNNNRGNAQEIGNLLQSDRTVLSIAGEIDNESQVDWYSFALTYEGVDGDNPATWSSVFDIDYADGMRGDLTLSVFNSSGQLIFVGRDSDIVDDQPGAGQGTDSDDLSRGSFGKLDPFIGSVNLPAGGEQPRNYFVAVSSNDQIPSVLDQTFLANATYPLVRLQPISSVTRIVEDHLDEIGYTSSLDGTGSQTFTAGLTENSFNETGANSIESQSILNIRDPISLDYHVRPWTLADMTGWLTTTNGLRSVNPSTMVLDVVPNNQLYSFPNGDRVGDIDMLTNGQLVAYVDQNGNDAANLGAVYNIDPATTSRAGLVSTRFSDGISDDDPANAEGVFPNNNIWQINNSFTDAIVIGRSGRAAGDTAVLYEGQGTGNNASAASAAIYLSVRDNAHTDDQTRSIIYAASDTGDASMSIDNKTNNNPGLGRMGFVPGTFDNDTPTLTDDVSLGFVTGLQFQNEVRNANSLYAATSTGAFFRINTRGAEATVPAADTNDERLVNGVYDDELVLAEVQDFSSLLDGNGFAGLSSAPLNLEGGRYQGMFFGVLTNGQLVCIDPNGGGAGVATLLDNVFDTDADGIADSYISSEPGLNNVTGFAMTLFDINAWHPTHRRDIDTGHGIETSPSQTTSNSTSPDNNVSMYFGLEMTGVTDTYQAFGTGGGQFGVQAIQNGPSYDWQGDLAVGAGVGPSDGANYNMPGGAHGSLITDSFSLSGYQSTDKPTLYFNYYLETEGDDGQLDGTNRMKDSARVFASRDAGLTWELLTTNNSLRDGPSGTTPSAELPTHYSVSSAISTAEENGSEQPNQRVQELFDNTNSWRQARVDLADFAGENQITLRFDFSTGGDLDRGEVNNTKIVPDAIRTVTSAVTDLGGGNWEAVFDSGDGIQVGMIAQRFNQQDIDPSDPDFVDVANSVEGSATVVGVAIDPDTLAATVTMTGANLSFGADVPNEEIAFFAVGADKDNILSNARTIGEFDHPNVRTSANSFEGWYVDDFIVGFAERGEEVVFHNQQGQNLNPAERNSDDSFWDIETRTDDSEYMPQILEGEYQLEIRRGSFLTSKQDGNNNNVGILETFDTNDRFIEAPAETSLVLEQNSFTTIDGETVSTLGNATFTQTTVTEGTLLTRTANNEFELQLSRVDNLRPGMRVSVDVPFQPSQISTIESVDWRHQTITVSNAINAGFLTPVTITSAFGQQISGNGAADTTEHGALLWKVNLENQDSVFLEVDYWNDHQGGDNGEQLSSLPATFTVDDTHGLPSGDGVAISVDDGVTWTRVSNFSNTRRGVNSIRLTTLEADLSGFEPGADTVIGFFRSGSELGGIGVANGVLRTAPEIRTTGQVGDQNVLRPQGQFVIQNNLISDSATYGILIDASRDSAVDPDGNYTGTTNMPHGGVAQNFGVQNNARLVPGVTVMNNVVAESGTGGILFSGDSNAGNVPNATVPSGRLINNTIYNDDGTGVGIDISDNAAAILLNNVFAGLANGVQLDGTSDDLTVIAASAFYNISGEEVSGPAATQNEGVTLTSDPFVNAAAGNFYPVENAGIIDNGMDSLQQRVELTVVTDPLGIARSPVITPARDLRGQLRTDDPNSGNDSGLGDNAFKDRGAYDRVDFTGPTARLVGPLDGSLANPEDEDTNEDSVRIAGQTARQLDRFVIQLNDSGAGIETSSIQQTGLKFIRLGAGNGNVSGDTTDSASFDLLLDEYDGLFTGSSLTVNGAIQTVDVNEESVVVEVVSIVGSTVTLNQPVSLSNGDTVEFDKTVLQESIDYTFEYNTNTSQVVLLAPAVYSLGQYLVEITAVGRTDTTLAVFTDLAGNPLQGNTNDGKTTFLISLEDAPLAPSGVSAIKGDSEALVQWTPLGNSEFPVVTDYVVQFSTDEGGNWTTFADTVSDEPSVTVDNLVNNQPVIFRVAAINNRGQGEFSSSSLPVTPDQTPGKPENVIATAGVGELTIAWEPPLVLPSLAIDSYEAQISSDNGSTWSDLGVVSTPYTFTTIEGAPVENGTSYRVRVRAVNGDGPGEWALSIGSATPRNLATAPEGVSGVIGDQQVSIWWSVPSDTDGGTISGYVVTQTANSVGETVPYSGSTVPTEQSPLVITNLSNGTEYSYEIQAITEVGQGQSSAPYLLTPAVLPDSPGNLVVVVDDESLDVTWDEPISDGGEEIISYEIEWSTSDFLSVTGSSTVSASPRSFTVPNLTNGEEYTVRIRAVNSVGESLYTESNVQIPGRQSTVPQDFTVTANDQRVRLDWSVPADSGGGELNLLEYEIFYKETYENGLSDSGNVDDGTTDSTSFDLVLDEHDGLFTGRSLIVNGALQTVDVNGESVVVKVVSIVGSTVTLNQPVSLSDGDAVAFDKVTAWSEDPNFTAQPQLKLYNVLNLVNGTRYDFKIRAVTEFGAGIEAEQLNVIPSTIPGSPTNLQISGALNEVTVTWDAPANGGAPISDYIVQYKVGSGIWQSFDDGESPTRSVTVGGLTNGVPVVVRVAAVNAVGQGVYSGISDPQSPGQSASAPTITGTDIGDGEISLSWLPPPTGSTGGLPVTGYRVQKRVYDSDNEVNDNWTTARTTSADTRLTTVQGLDNGTMYDLRVAAVTSFGAGDYDVVTQQTPAGPAAAPTGLIVNASSGAAQLQWTAPADDGGSAISGHRVQYRVLGTDAWTDRDYASAAAAASVPGLANGQTYEFRVAATTSYSGPEINYSEISQRLIGDVPAAPPNFQVMRVGAQVIAEWHDASAPQGVAIEKYTVEYRRADQNFWTLGATVPEPGNAAFMSLSRFNLSFQYEFRVAAVANTGTGNYATSGPKSL